MFNNFSDASSAKNRYIHVFTVAFVALLITTFFVSNKKVGHIDEFLSYSLANSGYMGRNHPELFERSLHWYTLDMIQNKDNAQKIKAHQTIWDEPLLFIMFAGGKTALSNDDVKHIMMPSDEAKFNFAAVNWNQSFDVHPPLYYMLLNAVCSVFYNNGNFSPWHGLFLNLVIFFFTLPLVYYLMWNISKGNHGLSIAAMCVYTLSGGGCTVAFLRMYMLLTFFTLLYTYLILKFFEKNPSNKLFANGKFYAVSLFLTIVLGSLSHHYFLLYLGISGLFLCTYLIFTHKKDCLMEFLKISVPSVIVSLLIFPFTILHMFFGEHSAGDIMGRFSNSGIFFELFKYIGEYLDFVKHFIFGGAANFILSFLLTALLILYFNRKKFKAIAVPSEMWFLAVTSLSFLIFVALTTKYHEERYIMNLYPIFSVLFLYLFYIVYKAFFENIRFKPLLLLILFVLMANNNIKNISAYMYSESSKRYDILEKYRNLPCVYVYDKNARSFVPRFGSFELIKELPLYSGVYFVEYEHFNEFLSTLKDNPAIVYFCSYKGDQWDGDKERIENTLKSSSRQYTEITREKEFPVYKLEPKK